MAAHPFYLKEMGWDLPPPEHTSGERRWRRKPHVPRSHLPPSLLHPVGPHQGWGTRIFNVSSIPEVVHDLEASLSQYGQDVLEIQSQTFHALGSRQQRTLRGVKI